MGWYIARFTTKTPSAWRSMGNNILKTYFPTEKLRVLPLVPATLWMDWAMRKATGNHVMKLLFPRKTRSLFASRNRVCYRVTKLGSATIRGHSRQTSHCIGSDVMKLMVIQCQYFHTTNSWCAETFSCPCFASRYSSVTMLWLQLDACRPSGTTVRRRFAPKLTFIGGRTKSRAKGEREVIIDETQRKNAWSRGCVFQTKQGTGTMNNFTDACLVSKEGFWVVSFSPSSGWILPEPAWERLIWLV